MRKLHQFSSPFHQSIRYLMAPWQQRVKAKVGELTAKYYLGKLDDIAKAEPTPKKYAPTTKELIESV